MTNTNVAATRLAELGGASNAGWKIGFVDSAAKAAQNDTWTITNASQVQQAFIQVDASGAAEGNTTSANVITLTSATTGACSGLIIYR